MNKLQTHSLERTNTVGEKFIGYCVLCGQTNLPMKAVGWTCSNPDGVTTTAALIDAIERE